MPRAWPVSGPRKGLISRFQLLKGPLLATSNPAMLSANLLNADLLQDHKHRPWLLFSTHAFIRQGGKLEADPAGVRHDEEEGEEGLQEENYINSLKDHIPNNFRVGAMAEERQCSNLPKARTKLQHFRHQSSINGSTYKESESSACNLKPQCHSPHSWLANGQTVEKAETASIKELISKATGKTGVEEFYRLKIHVPDRLDHPNTAVGLIANYPLYCMSPTEKSDGTIEYQRSRLSPDRHYWYPCPVGAGTCDKSTADNRLVSIKVPIGCGWTPERIFVKFSFLNNNNWMMVSI
ncbi:hypothetical protein Bbelb_018430 [Branchiostoma belcheri]|nr:hypothetical protein Bbelb_018430 [Branchiostoma belcheri]